MIRIAQRKCPVCENNNVNVLHSQKFALPEGHPLSDGYDVVSCVKCGFVFADTSVPQEVYDRFYQQFSKYEDQKTGTGGIVNVWDHKRLQDTAGLIAAFLNNKNARLLDVGCANGGLLKSLQELGYSRVFGIDPSPVCVENTKRIGIDSSIGSLMQPLNQSRFDCIILSHTLEHVQDLKQAALWIQSNLDIDAFVYVEVPDADRYADFVNAPFQDFNTEHINHFSMTSLQNYLRVNDFEPLKCGRKTILASKNKPYPAIFCFAKRSDGKIQGLQKDSDLEIKIQRYITISNRMLNLISAKLNTVLSDQKKVIVWGVGQLTMKLLVETSLAEANIIAFVDSNPINQGKMLRGVRVIAPEKLTVFSEPILISTTLHQQSIIEQIHEMGLKNELILLK